MSWLCGDVIWAMMMYSAMSSLVDLNGVWSACSMRTVRAGECHEWTPIETRRKRNSRVIWDYVAGWKEFRFRRTIWVLRNRVLALTRGYLVTAWKPKLHVTWVLEQTRCLLLHSYISGLHLAIYIQSIIETWLPTPRFEPRRYLGIHATGCVCM